MSELIKDVLKGADCLFSLEQVEQAIQQMANEISTKLAESDPVVLSIMNGGLIFAGKLIPQLNFPLQMDYCHATRYRGETSGSELHWKSLPQVNLSDRVVLVVDDIYDEGHTLLAILKAIAAQNAKAVYTAVLVDKDHDRKADPGYRPDFIGLTIPDRYVFGFGMDYKEYWRNAPGIYAVKGM